MTQIPAAFSTYRYFGSYRLFLAAMVMFHHFAANAAPMEVRRLFLPYEIGSLAVLAFFCLSGFVIVEAADTAYQRRPRAFMANRLMRVFPHFIAAMTLSIIFHAIFIATGTFQLIRDMPLPPLSIFNPSSLMVNYFGIVPLFEKLMSYEFLDIAWAVRIEMVFYIVVAGCLWIATKQTRISFVRVISLTIAVLIPPFVVAVYIDKFPTFGFLPYFAFGGALYYIVVRNNLLARVVGLLSIVGMAGAFLAQPVTHLGYTRHIYAQFAILCVLIGVIVVLALIKGKRFQHADSAAGKITYPLYMYHFVIMVPTTSMFIDAAYTYPFFVGGMIASIWFSMLMTRLIDPIVDHYRDHIRGRRLQYLSSKP